MGVPPHRGWARCRIYGGQSYRVLSDWQFGQPLFKGTVNGTPVCIQVERRNLTLPSVPLGLAGRCGGAHRPRSGTAGRDAGKETARHVASTALSQCRVCFRNSWSPSATRLKAGPATGGRRSDENGKRARRRPRRPGAKEHSPPSADTLASISRFWSSSTTQWTRSKKTSQSKMQIRGDPLGPTDSASIGSL